MYFLFWFDFAFGRTGLMIFIGHISVVLMHFSAFNSVTQNRLGSRAT